jgi:DNA-binding SARP family transcriptional activator
MPTSPADSSSPDRVITAAAKLFGPPSVQRGGNDERPTPVLAAGKPLVLLARLILDRREMTREAAMAFLWPEMPEIRARASLRQTLHLLRKAIGPDILDSDRQIITLAPGFPSDVDTFLRSVAEADDEAVVQNYGGVFLDHLSIIDSSDADQWIEYERRRLARLFQDAVLRRTSFLTASRQIHTAVALARRLRDSDPTIARFWRPLITALNAGGNLRDVASECAALRAHVEADLIDDPELARVIIGQTTVDEAPAMPVEIVTLERHPSDTRREERSPFIGCDAELAHLASIWQRVGDGHAERCLIVAPDGAGKSTLLREFATRIPSAGTIVIATDAERWMRDDPMSYVSRLIEQLVDCPAAINVSRQSASTLAAIAPTVRRRLPADPYSHAPSHPAEVAAALREVLTEIAGEAAIVLLLDDLHAADADSLAVLGSLLDEQQTIPLLMLGAGHRSSTPALADWPVYTLAPFRPEQTALQLAHVTRATVGPDVVEPIHRAAAGRPLDARQIMQALHECGRLRITGGLADWTAAPIVSINSHDVLPARVARRSAEERALLDILAVAGCTLPVSMLTDLLPTTTRVVSVVQVLDSDHLLALDDCDAVRMSHDRIAVTVLRAMSIADRQTIARRVGLALARRASTFHEMRRVMQLLIVAEARTDLAEVLDQWDTQWAANNAVPSAVTETLRSALRPGPPREPRVPMWRATSRAAATAGAVIGALAVALLAWRC